MASCLQTQCLRYALCLVICANVTAAEWSPDKRLFAPAGTPLTAPVNTQIAHAADRRVLYFNGMIKTRRNSDAWVNDEPLEPDVTISGVQSLRWVAEAGHLVVTLKDGQVTTLLPGEALVCADPEPIQCRKSR